MLTLRHSWIVGILGLALLAAAPASPAGKMSAAELDNFIETYYQHPRPELIAASIESVEAAGWVQNRAAGYVGFLSEILLANPPRMQDWRRLISRQDPALQEYLRPAFDLAISGGLLAGRRNPSPELTDLYWGAFFASGNPAYLEKLVQVLRFVDERRDQNLFFAGGTAKWSLVANAAKHPLVLGFLRDAAKSTDQRTGEIIQAMLKQAPEDVAREIRDVVDRQKAAGVWK